MNKIELKSKLVSFHVDDEAEMKIFRILERKRYTQSQLIIKLLTDFFSKFNIDEHTPYDILCFTIQSYLDSGKTENEHKYKVMQIMHGETNSVRILPQGDNPVIPQYTNAPSSPVQTSENLIRDEGEDTEYVNGLASGFDSMLD